MQWLGLEKFKIKQFNNLDYPAKPRWPLDENAAISKRCWSKTIMQYWLLNQNLMFGHIIDQQKKAGKPKGATWDGVRKYQAANNLKSMKKEINVFFIIQILVKKLLVL